MNFLITNSVPLNGGDEALLRATIESLAKRFPGSKVTTLCKDVEIARKYLPDLDLDSDLEFVKVESIERVGKLYREADIILSAPGGFLHDFYAIEERLRGFEAALALHKPVILLGQSLGPFWKPESLKRIPEVLNRVSYVCVRDAISKRHLLDAGVRPEKIREAGDMAFLWRSLAPELFQHKEGSIRTIALCFRVWPIKNAKAEKEILAKAEELCRFLLEEPLCQLVFLSTCQGVSGYVDDSAVAEQIVKRLPDKFQERCHVNRSHLGPQALIEALGECDAFIGMRLHGCILSMLGGTPAMGVGYEPKTKEIFGQLGLDAFQIPFESDAGSWLACAERFLEAAGEIRSSLPGILDRACQRADLNLVVVEEEAGRLHQKKSPVNGEAVAQEQKAIEILEGKWHLSSETSLKVIRQIIPHTSRFILVDDTLWAGRFSDRNPIPFLEKDGAYWGPPADDAKAISELERLREDGAAFIVFASPCFWWLEFYAGFHSHLQQRYQHVFGNDELVIFELRKVF